MRTSRINASLKRLGPLRVDQLPSNFDAELILQVVDFATIYSHTILHGKISYYLTEILARIRDNKVNAPIQISRANHVAKALIRHFSSTSRIWQFVHVS